MIVEKELHDIPIEEYEELWINNVRFSDVDKLQFTTNFMEIYYKNKLISKIYRQDIETLKIWNYEDDFETDLIDNLIQLFDVRIVGAC